MARFLTIDVEAMTSAERARFAARYFVAESGCWLWTAGTIKHGYGRFKMRGKTYGAHRLSYALAHRADVPAGMVLDHLCRNERCVNPAHLEPVTYAENTARGDSPNAEFVREAIDSGKCIRGHVLAITRVTRPGGHKSCAECDRQASAERRQRLAGDAAYRESERLRAIDYRARKSA